MIGATLFYFSNLSCVLVGLVYPLIASYHTAKQFIQKQEEYEIVIKFQKLQEKKKREGIVNTGFEFNTPERQEQLWKEEQVEMLEGNHKKWLAYWMIYTILYAIEFILEDFFYNTLPIYYIFKLAFVIYVITSKSICIWFFDNCVYKLMKWENLEQDIDKVLSFARGKLYTYVGKYFEGSKEAGAGLLLGLQQNLLPFVMSFIGQKKE
ncbi:predicted protein [Naegleria gruberi]|uniref:Predicted protein n=1 Tax=Naegleria gruberi TaxID=5762 RepID=D2VNZ6_NAEGR|nr:uncharacterized protein NAEGRDRAFT_70675 [Naegleria gruberi]EFC41576.1 predicted protein [Naegleria gruberi]|eukprot:XP_002674320.1 predicted protein [Naegleria gruberi strain NEG-M]